MGELRVNDLIGVEVQSELATKTVVSGKTEYKVKLVVITNPLLNRIEYATLMPGGSTILTRDIKQAIEDFNSL